MPADAAMRRMAQVLNVFPPSFRGNPLHLLSLDCAKPIRSPHGYLRILDSPALSEECSEYLLGESGDWPFPSVKVEGRPDPRVLSETLFQRFDEASQVMPTQAGVGAVLLREVRKAEPDIVLLMIVDGLSYYDLDENDETIPCLVHGVTATEFGHRSIIGKPSISQRLFDLGYKQQIGLSHFDTEANDLANELYSVFGPASMRRIRDHEDAIQQLRGERLARGFVQLTDPGLDSLCHHHRGRPPIQTYLADITHQFDTLMSCLAHRRRRVVGCLTADHGILWRDHLGDDPPLCTGVTAEETHHPRYVRGGIIRDCTRLWRHDGCTYSLLRFPTLTRRLKQTEWGVHGGISAWESIVPVVIRTM